jgi:PAS domain S-box-containing protein
MSGPDSFPAGARGLGWVLQALPVAVAQCSSSLRFVWVSQRYADWLGVPREQVVGRLIADVLGAECVANMRPHVDAALAGRATEREAQLHHKGLGPRWVHVDCVPTFDASGAPDGWIEAISDVTEHHRAEAALRESQNTLQSFYDSSPFFMGLVQMEGDTITFLYTNRALAEELGMSPERMVHHRADEFATPEQVELWREKYRESRREGLPVQFEYALPTPQGTRWLRATVGFVGEEEPGRPHFSFIAEEITETKRMVDALQEANRSKDAFLAMLGHELRNPLSPIVTALELLKAHGDGPYQRTLGIVERQVQYLVRLVDDLMDVSRVARGQVSIKKRLLRLQDVVAEGLEMAMPLIERRRHHVDVLLPAADLRLDGDVGRLAQVVGNLLTNAAKYTEPGGHIVVQGDRRGDELELVVRDDGMGIAPELLPHVFDLFIQGRQAADRARGGLGIGLTIVRNLVELHGGSVRAESAGPGQGSTFTVRLPAVSGEPTAVQRQERRPPPSPGRGKRVLVVDDNEDALALLSEVLRGSGNEVVTACDGPSALEALKSFPADVAILDIGLPVMDGYELARRIQALGPSVPRLIALTGYGQEADRARTLAAGFAHHLTKPVEIGCLLGALHESRASDART